MRFALEEYDDRFIVTDLDTDNRDEVAEVHKCGDEDYDKDVIAGYARLIAAAPDLLEALKECLTDDNANCIVTNDVAYMIRRFKAINKIVSAAIAKATGE